jgi:hypothetical protein
MSASLPRSAPPRRLARFIYRSVDERFQRGVYYLTPAGCKRPLPHFLLGKRDFSLFFSRFGL